MFTIRLNNKRNQYGEYVVKVFKNDELYEPDTYYTDDYYDALKTMRIIAKDLHLKVYKDDHGVYHSR